MALRRCTRSLGPFTRTLSWMPQHFQYAPIAALPDTEMPHSWAKHAWVAAAAAAAVGTAVNAATCDSGTDIHVLQRKSVTPSQTVDVVVVGSGAAGSTAALSAKWSGAGDVLLLEKDPKTWGGTTSKSGGTFWIPNHPLMEAGLDQKEPTLRFMAKLSYPEKYNPKKKNLGLDALDYAWLSQYYDEGPKMCNAFREKNVMQLDLAKFNDGGPMIDYNYDEENPLKQGRLLACGMDAWMVSVFRGIQSLMSPLPPLRTIFPSVKDALFVNEFGMDVSYGVGVVLVDKLKKGLTNAGVQTQMGHAVDAIVLDGEKVVGVRVKTDSGSKVIEAKKGVIFGSGGFANNKELREKYLHGSGRPIDGTGACKGAEGILVRIGEQMGLDLVHMKTMWGSQCYEEQSQQTFETPGCIFMMRGDSMFVVNRTGKRVQNEKLPYNTRVRKHWEDGNRFMFLIADQRAVDLYGCDLAMTLPRDPANPVYIKGQDVADLTKKVRERLSKVCAGQKGVSLELADNFADELTKTLEKYNGYATVGKDLDFNRGGTDSQLQWSNVHNSGYPNKCMCPLDTSSGLYCIILGPQCLDTKGGPRISLDAQCMRKGKPVPGLYACGNSAGPITADAYWSGGATIGSAMVGGWMAGQHIAKQ